LRLAYSKSGTLLADLPIRSTLDVTTASRWRLTCEHTLPLRSPEFLEVPESRRALLRERFGASQLLIPELYGYVLTDVSVVGENCVVFKDGTFIDSTLVMDAAHPIRRNPFVSDLLPVHDNIYESKWLEEDGSQIDEPTVFLGSAGVDMYHHWLFDAVTKLAILDPEAFPCLRYAVPDNVPAPMLDWLQAFGIEERRVVRTQVDVRTRFHRLILLPRIATSDVMLPHALERLRKVAEARDTRSPMACDRIFIARTDAPNAFRQLLNEREIRGELAKLGYVALTPGDFSPFEQARLFAQADRIIALHGSGAANVVFTSEGARVMHLQPVDADYFTQHGLVSAVRGQVFGYVFGETFARERRFHNVEWVVDWETTRKAVQRYHF
jgi:capsular polysaccharide biosynthesis protein